MTTKMLAEIEHMNKAGMNDRWIAEKLGVPTHSVRYYRMTLGLPTVGRNRCKKKYTVYDGKTTQFIIEGTSKECAARLGIQMRTFHEYKSRFRNGSNKKYEIYEVEEGDTDADYYNGS